MSIIRLLLLIVVIWAVYRFIRGLLFSSVKRDKQNKQDKPTKMVKCPYCSVYITKADAYSCDDRFYCSYDHYRKMTNHNNNDPDIQ